MKNFYTSRNVSIDFIGLLNVGINLELLNSTDGGQSLFALRYREHNVYV